MIHLALSNVAEVNLYFRHYKCCINYCKIQVTSRLNFSAPHKQTYLYGLYLLLSSFTTRAKPGGVLFSSNPELSSNSLRIKQIYIKKRKLQEIH